MTKVSFLIGLKYLELLLKARAKAAEDKVASLEQSLSSLASAMSDKERSRENVGRREENMKVKARQLNLMVREAEARSAKMDHVRPRILQLVGSSLDDVLRVHDQKVIV